jgi:peroxiredoxin Q/BCP
MKRKLALSPLVAVLFAAVAIGQSTLRPGDAFPDWSLVDQNGATLSSADLRGKRYLLWFYPKAMTPGCTAEGRGLRDDFDEFQKLGVDILGVSFDAPKDNAEFVRTEKFPFRLLSDSDHKLAVAVGAALSADQGFASRISYLVGADGKVVKVYDSVQPSAHASQVLGDLRVTQ